MRCKNPECKVEGGYIYWVVAPEYEWEYCNICGHSAPFRDFVEEVEDCDCNRNS